MQLLSHSSKGLLDRFARVFEERQSFVLTTHRAADGDGIGAELALQEVLERMGTSVLVINSESNPRRFRRLPGAERIQIYSAIRHRSAIESSDVVMPLDAALPERTGELADAVQATRGVTVAIDHHHASGWAELELIDKDAPSTTTLLYHLLVKLDVTLTPDIATALYLGLVADTSGFRNAAANSEAHSVAAQLLRAGASRDQVESKTVDYWPVKRMRLKGRFLQTLRCTPDGRVAWGTLTPDDFGQTCQDPDATRGFADEVLDTTGAEVSMLFLEETPGTVRIRFRSREAPVNTLAEKLGGGGHRLASGTLVDGPLEQVIEKTVSAALRTLE